MASVTKKNKITKENITKVVEITRRQPEITLKMNLQEALAVLFILGRVAGGREPDQTIRRLTSLIYRKLYQVLKPLVYLTSFNPNKYVDGFIVVKDDTLSMFQKEFPISKEEQ